jgi:hypothetical protein
MIGLSVNDFAHALQANGAHLYRRASEEPKYRAGSILGTFDV